MRTPPGCRGACRPRARRTIATGQSGRAPPSAQAACTAGAERDVLAGRRAPRRARRTPARRSTRTAGFCAAPPISRMRRAARPGRARASRPSASPHSIPSTAARARFSRVVEARVMPNRVAVASGRFGVRSPSKYGTAARGRRRRARRRARGGRARRGRRRAARAIASSTRAALSVATSGRKRAAASAKPATVPDGVGGGGVGDREDRAARADRDDDVAGVRAEPERGAGVVAGAGADGDAGRRSSVAPHSPGPSTRGRTASWPRAATSSSRS